ncbi:sulfite exporter TauE/SafE family protein [Variovorax sp. J22R133]|uniref:sulfite exporter TauE/SafE family protein n=1 Tax=Variovorax brevis TaxID=3053503 RepID=UPI0025778055|nr:sulfite exporter TauE/SafE family protein [Variovorax sp. J22R133]MDM0117709.1 sulfite exporter TauE/SafE family protein [Variovorax sp. J22R133]
MQLALAGAALAMGLAGGPHCVAMCGAASAGVIRLVRAPVSANAGATALSRGLSATLAFHVGRVASYAVAGAAVAMAAQSLAFASVHVAAVRPLWVMFHAALLAWGVALMVLGRQPAWAHDLGRELAGRVRRHTRSGFGVLATGALWVLMPCGLLYSALALASLGNGPFEGAIAMVLFALGSGLTLVTAPWLWQRLRARMARSADGWGARMAGVLLAALAAQALWMDLGQEILDLCR